MEELARLYEVRRVVRNVRTLLKSFEKETKGSKFGNCVRQLELGSQIAAEFMLCPFLSP